MKLYHGTSERHLDAIMAGGLWPRRLTGRSNFPQVPSAEDRVYLTDTYPLWYAIKAMDSDGGGGLSENYRRAVVLELDVPEDAQRLLPDEDALEQAARRVDNLPKTLSPEARVLHYRARARQEAVMGNDYAWSLKALGTCSWEGAIPRECIKRVALVDVQVAAHVAWDAMQAQVVLLGHRFCGDRHKHNTAALFDVPPIRGIEVRNILQHAEFQHERV